MRLVSIVLACVAIAGCAERSRPHRAAPIASTSPAEVMSDVQLGVMFEHGWALYIAGDEEQGLAELGRALAEAERAAGVPEGDRSLRSTPVSTLVSTSVVGDRVLVPTSFLTFIADPRTGRIERAVRGLQRPEVIRGTSLVLERAGEARTQILDGKTLAPIATWTGPTEVSQSADGALVAIASTAGERAKRESELVVFDTRERRVAVRFPVPALEHAVRFADDGKLLVIGGDVRDARSGRLLFSQARELASTPFAGSYVAFVAPDGAVGLADRDTWKPIARTRACPATGPLAFDPSAKSLAIGGTDTACVVDVPSLKVRRSHAGRRLPIAQHPEIEGRLTNQMVPSFVGAGQVLALTSSRTAEISLFDATSGRELFHGVGELFEPKSADAYVVTAKEPRERITVLPAGTIERHALSKEEFEKHWRSWSIEPSREVVDRIRANLCVLHWGAIDRGRGKSGEWIVPRDACAR